MPATIILERRIGLGVDVPLDRGKLRQLAALHFFKSSANVADDVALLGQQMNRGVVLPAVFGQTFECRQTIQRQIHLHRRASTPKIVDHRVERRRKILHPDQRSRAKRIGIAEHNFRRNLPAIS